MLQLAAAMLVSLAPGFRQASLLLAALGPDNPNASWADKIRHVPPALVRSSPPGQCAGGTGSRSDGSANAK